MAYEIPGFTVGVLPADVNMSVESTWQYAPVGVYTAISTVGTGIGGAALCAAASSSSPLLGVLQNNPQQGEAGTVVVAGVTKAIAGGTFNIGDLLEVSAGAFIKATSGNYQVAQALETAAAGDITTVLLIRNGKL